MLSRTAIGAVIVISLAGAAVGRWWWSPSQRLERAVQALTIAAKPSRFAAGRLTIDDRWSPFRPTSAERRPRPTLDVVEAALRYRAAH